MDRTSYYYIFYTLNGDNIYERTTQCVHRAKERTCELKAIYKHAEYFKNEIPRDYRWFY